MRISELRYFIKSVASTRILMILLLNIALEASYR